MMANVAIRKIKHSKIDIHHGCTVPYGMAVIAMVTSKALKII
jgi:hypothetical protein